MGASADRRLEERATRRVEPTRIFPLYLMKIGEELKFLSLREAGMAYDNGWVRVEIGAIVILDEHFSVRAITREERSEISRIADECSGEK